ncbi:hypothetical protein PIB30_048979 [Stylosanthes scabra]|uniref:Uncharacterized protein n=1 Tax=Stylosanthes scabra TaxID=79078 RepID=A0ABU6VHB5_9FABA|nr:hypothetical protein [Stylosanthes scabra]
MRYVRNGFGPSGSNIWNTFQEKEEEEEEEEEEEAEELCLVSNEGRRPGPGHEFVIAGMWRRARRREGLSTATIMDAEGNVRLTTSGGGGLRLDLDWDGGGGGSGGRAVGMSGGCGGDHGTVGVDD